jgi:hypothetical protein
MQMDYLMDWPNIKALMKKTNRREFKATNIIAKRYGKMRKKVDVLITLEMICFITKLF